MPRATGHGHHFPRRGRRGHRILLSRRDGTRAVSRRLRDVPGRPRRRRQECGGTGFRRPCARFRRHHARAHRSFGPVAAARRARLRRARLRDAGDDRPPRRDAAGQRAHSRNGVCAGPRCRAAAQRRPEPRVRIAAGLTTIGSTAPLYTVADAERSLSPACARRLRPVVRAQGVHPLPFPRRGAHPRLVDRRAVGGRRRPARASSSSPAISASPGGR